jgi:hypothetical protein
MTIAVRINNMVEGLQQSEWWMLISKSYAKKTGKPNDDVNLSWL